MTDQNIQTWVRDHQIATYTGALFALGALAGLMRARTPEEDAAFAKDHPRLHAFVDVLRTGFGIDAAKVQAVMLAVWTGKLLPELPFEPPTPAPPPPNPPAPPAPPGPNTPVTPAPLPVAGGPLRV